MAVLYVVVLLFCCFAPFTALARNVTVDDQNGDPETGRLVIYQPENLWTQGADCTGCSIQPDRSQAFDNTWHDSTFPTQNTEVFSLSLLFPGEASALYIFYILSNVSSFTPALVFVLNDEVVGQYSAEIATDQPPYLYNVPVYVNTSINPLEAQNTHNFTILLTHGTLFDYAVYTVPDNTSATSSAPPTATSPSTSSPITYTSSNNNTSVIGAAVGGAIGGAVLLSATCVALFIWNKRRNKQEGHYSRDDLLTEVDTGSHLYENTISAYPSTITHAPRMPPPLSLPSSTAASSVTGKLSATLASSSSGKSQQQQLEEEMMMLREQMGRLEARQREMEMHQVEELAPPGYGID